MIAGAIVSPAPLEPPVFSVEFRRELDMLFRWRRDVRRFRSDAVPERSVEAVIASMASAPSVGLSEPWRLVRVDDPARRTAVIENFTHANAEALAAQPEERRALYAGLKLAGLQEAPVQLAVFCDDADEQGRGLGIGTMPEMKRYSVVCAVMQMWLAARALGLGIGWVSILDPARLTRDLDTPDGWSLIAYLCLGWPEEDQADPELQRAGWEDRQGLAARVLNR